MGARSGRQVLGAALLVICTLPAACGDGKTGDGRPVVEEPPKPARSTRPAEAEREPTPAPPSIQAVAPKRSSEEKSRAINAAVRALDLADTARRREAVQVLLENEFEMGDLVRLAFRAARWQEDRGLLADLLSDYPHVVLPQLLRRIGHSAPVHRARLCKALGRVRENRHPAFSVVLLRALLDEFDGVRTEARAALGRLSERGPEIIRLHEDAFVQREDGSVGGLLPSAILGPHPDAVYVASLVDVLIYELHRFPGSDSFALARLLAELAGGANATARVAALLQEERLYGELLVRVLTGAGIKGLPLLRLNLQQGVQVNETLEALALMGTPGAVLVDAVTPYLVAPRYGRAAVRALWHIQAHSDAVQIGLFHLWEKEHSRKDSLGQTGTDAALLLRLLRPRRPVMDRVVRRIRAEALDPHTQTALLGFLGWCAAEERGRSRQVIEWFLATQPGRGVRLRGKASLKLLETPESEMRVLVQKALADPP